MTRHVVLPYLPRPYPGEILGSWIARLKLHNTPGIWNSLLRSLDITSRFEAFDCLRPSANLLKLLNKLDMSSEEAMLSHSTLPYYQHLPGLALVYIPHLVPDTRANIPHPLFNSLARYCSNCISEDSRRYGEPFWHRAHQLPNVSVCHLHHTELQVQCLVCHRLIGDRATEQIAALSWKCVCGARLDGASPRLGADDKVLKHALLSADALAGRMPAWKRAHAISYLIAKIGFRPAQVERIRSTWNIEPAPWRRGFPSSAELVLLLVSADINAETLGKEYVEYPELFDHYSTRAREKKGAQPIDSTLNFETEKRAMRSAYASGGPSALQNRFRAYFTLQIHDPEWLRVEFNLQRAFKIPTIEQDRASALLALKKLAISHRGSLTREQLTAVSLKRAMIRDSAWFEENIQTKLNVIKNENQRERFSQKNREQISLIRNSIEAALASEHIPNRISKISLSRMTGLGIGFIERALQLDPSLLENISRVNEKLIEKKVLRAIGHASEQGQTISAWGIMKHAKLYSRQLPQIRKLIDNYFSQPRISEYSQKKNHSFSFD